jgi:hypothetical protein
MVNISDIDSLDCPNFASFVAIARIERTSAIIDTILFVIATLAVGMMPV